MAVWNDFLFLLNNTKIGGCRKKDILINLCEEFFHFWELIYMMGWGEKKRWGIGKDPERLGEGRDKELKQRRKEGAAGKKKHQKHIKYTLNWWKLISGKLRIEFVTEEKTVFFSGFNVFFSSSLQSKYCGLLKRKRKSRGRRWKIIIIFFFIFFWIFIQLFFFFNHFIGVSCPVNCQWMLTFFFPSSNFVYL